MSNNTELYFSEMGAAHDLPPALAQSIRTNSSMLELVQLIEQAALTKFVDEDGTLKHKFITALEKIPDVVLVNAEVRPLYKKNGLSIDEFASEFGKRVMDGIAETGGQSESVEKLLDLMLVQAKIEETNELISNSFNAANLRLEIVAHMKQLLNQEGITGQYKAEPKTIIDAKGRHILYVDLSENPKVLNPIAERKIREVFTKMGVSSLDQECVPDGVVLSDPATHSSHCTALIAKLYEIGKNRGMSH